MATTKKRTHKDGFASYEIRVSMGRDINGKQIFKYATWEPEPSMTDRQIVRELDRQRVLFEEECRRGEFLDSSVKFADFASQWLEANEGIHSPKYRETAKFLLTRINAGSGHIRLDKLQPHHLQAFYKNLAEDGVGKKGSGAIGRDLNAVIQAQELTRAALADKAGIAPATITAGQGNLCRTKPCSIITG